VTQPKPHSSTKAGKQKTLKTPINISENKNRYFKATFTANKIYHIGTVDTIEMLFGKDTID
jgi:phage tail tube protein FII